MQLVSPDTETTLIEIEGLISIVTLETRFANLVTLFLQLCQGVKIVVQLLLTICSTLELTWVSSG